MPGGYADMAFTIETSPGTPLGNYTVAVTAGNGVISPSANIALGVGDFSFSPNPTTVALNSAAPPSTTASVTFVEGNNDPVTFACNGLPSGITCSGGSASAIAPRTTISVYLDGTAPLPAAADYPFTITGTGGTAVHTANAVLRVGNFSASLDHTTATLSPGQSATFTVALSSLNHFANSSIQVICQSAMVTCSTNPANAVLTDGGSTSVTLTVTAKAAAASLLPARQQPLSSTLAVLLLPFGWAASSRNKRLLVAAAGLMILCCLGACSNSSTVATATPGSPPPPSGTGSGSSATITVPVYGSALINGSVLQNSAGVLTLTLTN